MELLLWLLETGASKTRRTDRKIDRTCFTYDAIVKADDRIKCAGNLEPYEMNRGGILKRSYKHTVHRIEMPRPDGEIDEYHIVLEYATPLMALYDMSQHAECGLRRQERDEQVCAGP